MVLGDDAGTITSLLKDGGPTVVAFAVLVFGGLILTKHISPIVANLALLADKLVRAIESAERTELARSEHDAMFGSKLRQAKEVVEEARSVLDAHKPKSRNISKEPVEADE